MNVKASFSANKIWWTSDHHTSIKPLGDKNHQRTYFLCNVIAIDSLQPFVSSVEKLPFEKERDIVHWLLMLLRTHCPDSHAKEPITSEPEISWPITNRVGTNHVKLSHAWSVFTCHWLDWEALFSRQIEWWLAQSSERSQSWLMRLNLSSVWLRMLGMFSIENDLRPRLL